MVTTIQVDEKTLLILKKLKEALEASSYDEAINKIAIRHLKPNKSMAGSLKRYLKDENLKEILKELKEERRKSGRY
ncbi:hypothetical protein HYZ97_02595 [Candidatus Pacearchaeota archaeon]|nr:hypothetical protein [Candidatus Pacearchaeota archaeon]